MNIRRGREGFGNIRRGREGFGNIRRGREGFGNIRRGREGFGNIRRGREGFVNIRRGSSIMLCLYYSYLYSTSQNMATQIFGYRIFITNEPLILKTKQNCYTCLQIP